MAAPAQQSAGNTGNAATGSGNGAGSGNSGGSSAGNGGGATTGSGGGTSTGGSTGGGASSGGSSGSTGSASAPSSAPATAYVYVSATPQNGSVNQVEAYSAAADGTLTAVNGSPFQEDVTSLASNGNHLFGVNSDGFDLESYSVAADGSIAHDATAHVSETGDCNSLGSLFVDRSGSTLYALNVRGSGCANNDYESLSINSSTGDLTDLGGSTANNWLSQPASFIGNNNFAYTASCLGNMYWGIYGFQRGSNGQLTQINANATLPSSSSGAFYCPSMAAADAAGDVAIALQPVVQQDFTTQGAAQIAVFTAQGDGSLTTSSTATNMPQAQVGTVTDLKISPGSDLLAVAGSGGLQVFRMNGAALTAVAGLLTKDSVDRCFWDAHGHLYAVSKASGKLYVFTVSGSGFAQAPGSPHMVAQPQDLAVASL